MKLDFLSFFLTYLESDCQDFYFVVLGESLPFCGWEHCGWEDYWESWDKVRSWTAGWAEVQPEQGRDGEHDQARCQPHLAVHYYYRLGSRQQPCWGQGWAGSYQGSGLGLLRLGVGAVLLRKLRGRRETTGESGWWCGYLWKGGTFGQRGWNKVLDDEPGSLVLVIRNGYEWDV